MSCMMHTIHSKTFHGAASVGGSSYASPMINSDYGKRPITKNLKIAKKMSNAGKIDNLKNLKNSRVYVLHATDDEVVPIYLGRKIKKYYKNISDSVKVKEDIQRKFGHEFPTSKGEPIEILNHLYQKNIEIKKNWKSGKPIYTKFSMKSFCPDSNCKKAGIHDNAWLSASKACRNGEIECPVVFFLHGCTGSFVTVGMSGMTDTFFAHIAEKHDFVVVFPQTTAAADACWNVGWRGEKGNGQVQLESSKLGHLTYANPQAVVFKKLVDALQSKPNLVGN